MVRTLAIALLAFALLPAAAHAELAGPNVPPPAGCAAIPLSAVATSSGPVCVHRVLVAETWNGCEQNCADLRITDHESDQLATFRNWWPQGPPQAGMVLTIWGHMEGDRLVVDRWIDLAHGSGPAPAGPYPRARLLDVAAGRVPNNRTVWVVATTFALDPQDGGDGDIHVQTFSPCPGAGLTSETTPPLRGYVDHPAIPGLASTTDTSDEPSSHLADAPPLGIPVMMLGQIRVDYGFGWYELHPIRAWRPLSPTELATQASECADDPVMHFDHGPAYGGHTVPVPFGVPPCTDGSEFGSPPGFSVCEPVHCYVAHTAIDEPELLAGPCDGIEPLVTRSQEGLPEALPGDGAGAVDPLQLATAEREADREQGSAPALGRAVLRAYGPRCARAGARRAPCAAALAHLASEAIAPRAACRAQHAGRACVRAARRFARRLGAR